MHRLLPSFAAALVAAAVLLAPAPPRAASITIEARPVPLNSDDLQQTTVGKLKYRGGLMLTSPDGNFGSLSDLRVSRDGRRLVAIGDTGTRVTATLRYDAEGNLAGIKDGDLGQLTGLDGKALRGRGDVDAEAMAPGAEGELIVAFEREHRIWRYFPNNPVPEPIPPPEELKQAPRNGGIEAMTLLNDGRLLLIAEDFGKGGRNVAWVSSKDGWSVLTYAVDGGFLPTGAATLDNGDVLTIERRFTLREGAAGRIKRIAKESIKPGGHLDGAVVAEIRPPLTVDNFEGIEARKDADGRTLIYLISDDNHNPLQRTLLLMFELID